MLIVGLKKLEIFAKKHTDTKTALKRWVASVQEASWKTPHDIKERFRSADFLSDNRVIFNIKGNHYRLVVKVRYVDDVVRIDWVGTHAEYSKKTF